MQKSHLSLLEESVKAHSQAAAFQIPRRGSQPGIYEYESISYQQFWIDIDTCATHWADLLGSEGIPRKSVIGVWLRGTQYADLVQIFAVWRAGYIPQMISFLVPNPNVVYDLLGRAGAKALICSPSFRPFLENSTTPSPIPVHLMVDVADMAVKGELTSLPDISQGSHPNDTMFIFHTSGSTSGTPKLVPWSHNWLQSQIKKGEFYLRHKSTSGGQVVMVWMGNVCHAAQTLVTVCELLYGACLVQPTTLAYTPDELTAMIRQCRVNCSCQFAGLLSTHLRRARQDAEFLALLRSLDEVGFAGLALPREDEEWAVMNGINLRCIFASTECGIVLRNVGGNSPDALLYQYQAAAAAAGCNYEFRPISSGEPNSGSQPGVQLLELVVLSSSADCPDISLRSKEDGHFHTGDLFEEIKPGLYASRGRNDDWIKLYSAGRCDTKAIEANIRKTCSDLIEECVVVGSFRPCIALVVELARWVDKSKEGDVKKDIITRISPFHSTLLLHERLTDPHMILVVDSGQLPRTAAKGNVRRKAVEEQYKDELDKMYNV